MERTQDTRPVTNTMSTLRNFEQAVMERLVRYLDRKVRKYRRSHFCHFMLFLLAGRLCEVA
ncbi:MAG: hypothetical protein ACM34H_06150 [Deltaproteobacteria bacterium]